MSDAVAIRPAATDDDLAVLVDLIATVTPDDPTSVDEIRWSDATYPGTSRFVAERGGRAEGAATVGRIFVYPPEHPDLWAQIVVAADARQTGVGTALLEVVSARADEAGKTGLQFRAWAHRPEGIAFLPTAGSRSWSAHEWSGWTLPG